MFRYNNYTGVMMQIQYDAVILGAGINGVAIAKAIASENKKVLVIEKEHIASGASSHSSKLIHGGLRYLENFEFGLVKEALNDQKYILDNYSDLVKLHPFYLPLYNNSKRPKWIIHFGLWLYSFFSKHNQEISEISKENFLSKFKAIKKDELSAVFRYFDGRTDDYALTQKVAKEAKELGVNILEDTQIQTIKINDDIIELRTEQSIIQTNILVNATGAWIDEINERFKLPSSYKIEKLSGIHIVIDKALIPEPLILESSNKRIFFMIPETNLTIIGTTERSENSNVDDIKVNNEDVEYLLKQSNKYLLKQLKRKDIKEVYIGTRPIIKSKKDPTKMSREYKLDLHNIGKNNILNIYGGKLTTFPSLAKSAAKLLIK